MCRPLVCCTENHLNNFKLIRPGKTTYGKSVQQGKKIFIATDSMAQRIWKRKFYSHINGHTTLKAFPGLIPTYLHHYILPHIIENCPNTLVLHVGTNSIHDKEKGAEQIAKEVIEAGLTAKSFRACMIFCVQFSGFSGISATFACILPVSAEIAYS